MPGYSPLLVSGALGLTSVFIIWLVRCGRRRKNMPPGPPVLPIIGNALDFPRTFPFIQFTEWAREYGEIYSLKVFHLNMVVLSSAEAVRSILDKQGTHSGNRMHSRILDRGVGENYLAFADMGTDIWRKGRKAMHSALAPASMDISLPKHQMESLQLLSDILETPQDLYYHIRRMTASILTTLLYGQRSLGYKGTRVEQFYEAVESVNAIADLHAHPPVDLFPILQCVPARWAKWKGLCDGIRAARQDLYDSFWSDLTQRMASGMQSQSLIEDLIQNRDSLNMSKEEITAIGGVIMDAGSETTSSTIQNFVQMLVNYPECQRRAREEMDRVVGGERMPTIDDFDRLPYIQALIKELHRFRPVAPTGVPHVTSSDLRYKGYHIPKDSIIFVNSWGLYHDPEFFDDPDQFNPDRFLSSAFGTKRDADNSNFRDNLIFGAGRRICPGEHLANRVLAINVMNLLWAFEFSKDGTQGVDMSIQQYIAPGLALNPSPFTVSIKVRHPHRAAIIRTSLDKLAAS